MLVWQHLIGLHLHWLVLPLTFIILVAVGSDYNLLLINRVKEEIHAGLHTGLIRALGSTGGGESDWLRAWTRTAEKARSSQPHFAAPLVTTHVMLVQQFRDDMSWQRDSSGEPGLEGVGPQTPGI